jgi:hypothetical protein
MLKLDEVDLPGMKRAAGNIDRRALRDGARPGDPPRAVDEMLEAMRAMDEELETSRIRPVAECSIPLGLAERSGIAASAVLIIAA